MAATYPILRIGWPNRLHLVQRGERLFAPKGEPMGEQRLLQEQE